VANQKFVIKIKVTTECVEVVDESDVTVWAEVEGCDLEEVEILEVKEEEEEQHGAT
jgi:hypothetical protein